MKKLLTITLFINMLFFSGYTAHMPFLDQKPGDILFQDGDTSTPTNTATSTATNTPTSTNTPTDTSVPVSTSTPTNTAVPSETSASYPTITVTPTGSYQRPLLNLRTYYYDDSDTYAGGEFSIRSVFQNLGQQKAYNVVITFSSNDLTPVQNGGVAIIGSIDVSEKVSKTMYFAVADDMDYSPATINVDVDYKNEKGNSYSQSFTISISIAGYGPYHTATPEGRPQIVVSNYQSSVDPLVPGSLFVLDMSLQNRGLLSANNVDMTIGSTSSDSTDDNFLPVGSSNVQVIGDVAVQQTVKVEQSFVVNSDLEPGVYPLNLTFTYTDEDGNDFTDSQIITLLVYLVPSIQINFYEVPDSYNVSEQGTLPIQVVNLSSDDILLGDILVEVANAELSNYTTFVGTLESGGTFTMDTDITPREAGEIPVTVTLNYQDNFKGAETISDTLTITVEGQSFGGPGQSGQMQGTMTALDGAQQPGSTRTQEQSNGGFWNTVLRFIRGMIGFDSSATTNNRIGNSR